MRGLVKRIFAGALAVVLLCSIIPASESYAWFCGNSECGSDGGSFGTHVYKWCEWNDSEYIWVGHGSNKVAIHDKVKGAKYYLTTSNKNIISVNGLSWKAKKAGKATISLKQKLKGKVTTINKHTFTIRSDVFWSTRCEQPVKQTDLAAYADCIGTIRPGETKSFYLENSKAPNATPKLVGDSSKFASVQKTKATGIYSFTLKVNKGDIGAEVLTISFGDREFKVLVIPTLCIAPGEKFPFQIPVTYEEYYTGEDYFYWSDQIDFYAVGLVDDTYFSLGRSWLCKPDYSECDDNYLNIIIHGYYVQPAKNTPEGCYEIWPTYKGVKTKYAAEGFRYVWVTKDAAELNLFCPAPGYDEFFIKEKEE